MSTTALEFRAVEGLPEIEPGCDLAATLLAALAAAGLPLREGDVLVVAQKIVSKSEGRYLDLASLVPSARALEIAERTRKEPRFVEAVLRESSDVLRAERNVLITRHHRGYVMANAGIDRSNLPRRPGADEPGNPAHPWAVVHMSRPRGLRSLISLGH